MHAIKSAKGWNDTQLKEFTKRAWNITSSKELNKARYDILCGTMENMSFDEAMASFDK